MWWIITVIVVVMCKSSNCQYEFSGFNLQRQQNDFAFPQNDFVFPNFYPQPNFQYQNQKLNQRPQNYNNNGRPQGNNNYNINGQQQQQQGSRPKPTFAQKFTTARTTPLSFAPQLQTGILQVNRLDERIAQTSKKKV